MPFLLFVQAFPGDTGSSVPVLDSGTATETIVHLPSDPTPDSGCLVNAVVDPGTSDISADYSPSTSSYF